LKSFEEESRSDDYARARDWWEDRMNYLAVQILLHRNDLDEAERIIQEGLLEARKEHKRKREGCFLRMLGELNIKKNEIESAIDFLQQAVSILTEVANPRQLWQAHVSLARAFDGFGKHIESVEHWQKASRIVNKTAEGLEDKALRDNFISTTPIQEMFGNANQ